MRDGCSRRVLSYAFSDSLQYREARSTYYDWAGRADTLTATTARRQMLTEAVRSVFEEYRQTYGCRRIAHVVNTERILVAVGTSREGFDAPIECQGVAFGLLSFGQCGPGGPRLDGPATDGMPA